MQLFSSPSYRQLAKRLGTIHLLRKQKFAHFYIFFYPTRIMFYKHRLSRELVSHFPNFHCRCLKLVIISFQKCVQSPFYELFFFEPKKLNLRKFLI